VFVCIYFCLSAPKWAKFYYKPVYENQRLVGAYINQTGKFKSTIKTNTYILYNTTNYMNILATYLLHTPYTYNYQNKIQEHYPQPLKNTDEE